MRPDDFKPKERRAQSGSAIVYVIVGIFLFSALMYTLLKTGQSGQTNFSKYDEKILAERIVDTAKHIDNAVQKLRRKGCSENQISQQRDWNNNGTITNDATDRYNPNAPTDKSCHLFDAAGAGLTYAKLGTYDYGFGANRIQSVGCNTAGGTCHELAFYIKYVSVSLCRTINYLLDPNFNGTILTDQNGIDGFVDFEGTFNGGSIIGDDTSTLAGKRSACFYDNGGAPNGYVFYYTLIER